jgi:hypothetical protein
MNMHLQDGVAVRVRPNAGINVSKQHLDACVGNEARRVANEAQGWDEFILETAVVIAAKQRRSSVGAAFRAIPATAEQFQTGDRPPLKLFSRDSDLVRLAAVNCGF